MKNGKAKVIRKKPFQIQLLYQEEKKYQTKESQKTILGIDPGRQNIAISVITKNGEACALYPFLRGAPLLADHT